MQTTEATAEVTSGWGGSFRRAVRVLAMAFAAAGIVAACADPSAKPAASAPPGTPAATGQGSANATGDGPVSIHAGATATGSTGQRSVTVGFSLDFAKCMRAHGVPTFPDPDAGSGGLGPGDGVDPGSAPFQAAVNGPCRTLAPPAWVTSGQVGAGS